MEEGKDRRIRVDAKDGEDEELIVQEEGEVQEVSTSHSDPIDPITDGPDPEEPEHGDGDGTDADEHETAGHEDDSQYQVDNYLTHLNLSPEQVQELLPNDLESPFRKDFRRSLSREWPNILSERLADLFDCVLKARGGALKKPNSRKKNSPWFRGHMECIIPSCARRYTVVIQSSPSEGRGADVEVNSKGYRDHSAQDRGLGLVRRQIRGKLRKQMQEATALKQRATALAIRDRGRPTFRSSSFCRTAPSSFLEYSIERMDVRDRSQSQIEKLVPLQYQSFATDINKWKEANTAAATIQLASSSSLEMDDEDEAEEDESWNEVDIVNEEDLSEVGATDTVQTEMHDNQPTVPSAHNRSARRITFSARSPPQKRWKVASLSHQPQPVVKRMRYNVPSRVPVQERERPISEAVEKAQLKTEALKQEYYRLQIYKTISEIRKVDPHFSHDSIDFELGDVQSSSSIPPPAYNIAQPPGQGGVTRDMNFQNPQNVSQPFSISNPPPLTYSVGQQRCIILKGAESTRDSRQGTGKNQYVVNIVPSSSYNG